MMGCLLRHGICSICPAIQIIPEDQKTEICPFFLIALINELLSISMHPRAEGDLVCSTDGACLRGIEGPVASAADFVNPALKASPNGLFALFSALALAAAAVRWSKVSLPA
jgi:hypothetical protein